LKASDLRILAVDDDPSLLESIADLFHLFGFQVDTATSGNRAWELLEQNSYGVVVTDIRMPDGDGIVLLKNIKDRDVVRPGVLFISGFSEILIEDIFHYGAEGVFEKPFDATAIKNAIYKCLLDPRSKWAKASVEEPKPPPHIQRAGDSLEELEGQSQVVFGRGGFFTASPQNNIGVGKNISFRIDILGAQPLVFAGRGIVRWIQRASAPNLPPGIGIEISSMDIQMTDSYLKFFGRRVSFIPSPRLKSLDFQSLENGKRTQ
jgi:DNA-binding response OmpR family regulator